MCRSRRCVPDRDRPRRGGSPIRPDLIAAIREFTGAILNPFDLDDLLHRLMGHATEVMQASGAGIMLVDQNGRLAFVAASEQRVVDVERHQARAEQGACYEAYATNGVVQIDDIDDEDRWPEYVELVKDRGLAAVIGLPLNAFGQTIGVINIYRDHPTRWSDGDVAAGEILAAMGAGYILNANQLKAQHTLTEQLQSAVDSRDVIGQAKGIIMAQAGVDSDRSFELLRQRSQESNRKLREIAEELVADHGKDTAAL